MEIKQTPGSAARTESASDLQLCRLSLASGMSYKAPEQSNRFEQL
jgi:hypothetical protein